MSRWAWPLTVGAGGSLRTVQDGSAAQVAQSAALILGTVRGDRLAQPLLGIDDPAFGGLDVERALATLADVLPDADPVVLADAVSAAGVRNVQLGLGAL